LKGAGQKWLVPLLLGGGSLYPVEDVVANYTNTFNVYVDFVGEGTQSM
jgi:hypothetical protein